MPEGADPMRRNLADEAIWLGRLVVALLPDEAEALGLLALMLHAHARRRARRDAQGEYVPLAEQDIALWDSDMIDEAESLLLRASRHEAPSAAISSKRPCSRPIACASARGGRTGPPSSRLYEALASADGLACRRRSTAPWHWRKPQGTDAGLAALEALTDERRMPDWIRHPWRQCVYFDRM